MVYIKEGPRKRIISLVAVCISTDKFESSNHHSQSFGFKVHLTCSLNVVFFVLCNGLRVETAYCSLGYRFSSIV